MEFIDIFFAPTVPEHAGFTIYDASNTEGKCEIYLDEKVAFAGKGLMANQDHDSHTSSFY